MLFERRILLLATGTFVVATDGTLVVGLLRAIARSVGSSPSAVGQAVTAFAVVYAAGAPLVIRTTRRASPKRVLVSALALFALANAATAAAPSLAELLGARVVAGGAAGGIVPTAAAFASRISPNSARGLATVVGGASAATAVGVPLGTFLGGALGWRTAFYGIAGLSALVAVAVGTVLPSNDGDEAAATQKNVRNAYVLICLATTLLWAIGSFTFFTYIGVILHELDSVGGIGLAGYLLIFGLAGVAGAGLAGWFIDMRGPIPTLVVALALISASLAGLGVIGRHR